MTRFADSLHLGIDEGRLTRFASLLFAAPILPIVFAAIHAGAFLRSFPLLVVVIVSAVRMASRQNFRRRHRDVDQFTALTFPSRRDNAAGLLHLLQG